MPDVLIVPTEQYAVPGDQLPRVLSVWGVRYDHIDHVMSPPIGLLPGHGRPRRSHAITQTHMTTWVACPSADDTTPDAFRREVLQLTYDAFERATIWVRAGGRILVALGHGDHQPGRVHASFAPARFCYAQTRDLEKALQRRRGEVPASALNETQEFLFRLGRLLSGSRIERIDLLSCSVGVGAEGVAFVRLAATLFGHPVRALRGDLNIRVDGDTPYASVSPTNGRCPPRRRPRGAFCREYVREIPSDERLWITGLPAR